MPATIIDGKKIAKTFKETASKLILMLREDGLKPCLSVILVGDDAASKIYVRQKEKACKEVGLVSRIICLADTCTQTQLEQVVKDQVKDSEVVGVLVQMPLPEHLNAKMALRHIPPHKDVDGFGYANVGKLWNGEFAHNIACTPRGIIHAFDAMSIDLCGKHVVIVGRSNTVGKPLAALCLDRHATVSVCHSKTPDLASMTKQADILICAVGKAKLITADMVKPGAVVIDVGINRVDEKLCGDVDFDSVKEIASYITPVPGGVGPLTVGQLMLNAAESAWHQRNIMRLDKTKKENKAWVESLSQETNTETMSN